MPAGRKIVKRADKVVIDITDDILKQINEQSCEYFINTKNMQIENYDEHDDQGKLINANEDWNTIVLDISKIHIKKFSEVKEISFENATNFVKMQDAYEGYLNTYSELNYFSYRYYRINGFHPNVYRFEQFNMNLFVKDLFKNNTVPDNCYVKNTYQSSDDPKITSIVICFSKTLLLYIDGIDRGVLYYNITEEKIETSLLNTILGLSHIIYNNKNIKRQILSSKQFPYFYKTTPKSCHSIF